MQKILLLKNIVKKFDKVLALNDVSFEVKKGEIFGLLGPNGAGKTTLIRIINNIFYPDSGEVLFDGEKLNEKHLKQIGYLPEERGLYLKETVWEQLLFFATLRGLSLAKAKEEALKWLKVFSLSDWKNFKVGELSKGNQQKVQFIISVIHNPDLIILDEPFTGFDPINTQIVKQEILKLKEQGKTIIFSTHNMASVEELCDRIVLINKGQKLVEQDIISLKNSFSQDIYEVKFEDETELVSNDLFEIAQKISAKNYKIKLPDEVKIFQVIKFFNEQNLSIVEFRKLLPSLNDIFIKLVSQKQNQNNEL